MARPRLRLYLALFTLALASACGKDMLSVAKDALDVVCETRPLERLTMARDALADGDLDQAVALLRNSLMLDGPDREVEALLELLEVQQRARDALVRETPYP